MISNIIIANKNCRKCIIWTKEKWIKHTHDTTHIIIHSLVIINGCDRSTDEWASAGAGEANGDGRQGSVLMIMYANISSYLFINIQLWRQSLFNQCFYLDWRNALFYPKMWKFAIFDEIRTENRTIFAKKSEFQTFAEKSDHSGGTALFTR